MDIHIGYDGESLSVELDGKRYRGLFEYPDELADALKEAFEKLGHTVTTELEY